MGLRSALVDAAPLRSAPMFRRLWIGSTCSGLGSQMALVAVMFQVWQETHSPVWTGAVGLAQALPLLAFGLYAGALVDHGDRRRIYLVAATGQALCSAALAVQALLGSGPVVGVLALVAVQSGFGALGGPAAATFIRRLLPDAQLGAGLALNRIQFQAAMLVGPALGGLVVGWFGVAGCFLVDAATFLVAFVAVAGLPAMTVERVAGDDGHAATGRAGLTAVTAGLRFLAGNPAVRGALLTDLAAVVLAMPVSLFPLVNAQRFGDDPRTLGLFLTSMAVGGVIASLLSGVFTRRQRPGAVMVGASASWGIALALFGAVPDPWVGLCCLALAGAADTVAVVSRGTVVQLRTPDAMLGRVVAVEQVVGRAGPDVGNLRGGLVASASSPATALVSGGLLCVAAVALVAATTPALRRRMAAPGPAAVTTPAPTGVTASAPE